MRNYLGTTASEMALLPCSRRLTPRGPDLLAPWLAVSRYTTTLHILTRLAIQCRRPRWLVLLIAVCTPAFDLTTAQLANLLNPKVVALLKIPTSKTAARPFPRQNLQGAGFRRLPGNRSRVLLRGRVLPL